MMRPIGADFNLTALANRHGSDKGTVGQLSHHYTPFYEMLLGPRRDTVRRMLEIGLLQGGPEVGRPADRPTGSLPSIEMWLAYFPRAVVHGFDISDFSFFSHPRFVFTRGDAGVAADLERLTADGLHYDFIIDDGSHASFHQQLAFQTLFPALRPGGLYIIEDLHWQSPFYEESLPPTIRTAELVDHWFRHGHFPALPAPELAALPGLAGDIAYAFLMEQPFLPERRVKLAVIQKRF